MATIGLDSLFYAKITEDQNGIETYGTPKVLAKAMTAELSIELIEAILYADDGASEVVKEFKSGALSLGIDDIGSLVAQDLTGCKIDSNNVVVSRSEDGGSPVAVGFRAKKANGKYRYFWLYRVIFSVPATSLATKGDSITFSSPTIEGTVFRRNKLDGESKHPWKAEVTEGDNGVAASTITSWFTSVYEPDFTAANPVTYQWYENTIDSTTGGTIINGETSASFDIPTDLLADTYYYYCVLSSSGAENVTTTVATVVVS